MLYHIYTVKHGETGEIRVNTNMNCIQFLLVSYEQGNINFID